MFLESEFSDLVWLVPNHLSTHKSNKTAPPWSSYRTLLGINDDKMTEAGRTWAYFGKNARILILMRQTQKKVSG